MHRLKDDLSAYAEKTAKALQSAGYRADFTPVSLWEIDRFFDEHAENGNAKPKGLLSGELGARLFGIGAYIGEVVRRARAGEWECDDDDPEGEINAQLRLPDGNQCWPVQYVMKRFKQGSESGIALWGATLALDVGPAPSPRKGLFSQLFG